MRQVLPSKLGQSKQPIKVFFGAEILSIELLYRSNDLALLIFGELIEKWKTHDLATHLFCYRQLATIV